MARPTRWRRLRRPRTRSRPRRLRPTRRLTTRRASRRRSPPSTRRRGSEEERAMKTMKMTVAAALRAWGVGCGGGNVGTTPKTPGGPADGQGNQVSAAAANKFNAGLEALAQHDKANDWSDLVCVSTAQLFLDAAKEQ